VWKKFIALENQDSGCPKELQQRCSKRKKALRKNWKERQENEGTVLRNIPYARNNDKGEMASASWVISRLQTMSFPGLMLIN
jgi:hypothetical protein